jgi:hypothetical protein
MLRLSLDVMEVLPCASISNMVSLLEATKLGLHLELWGYDYEDMKRDVKTAGNWLSRDEDMGLPMDLIVKVVSIGIEMPASNAHNKIFVGTIDDFHIANRRISKEATSLFVEVEN